MTGKVCVIGAGPAGIAAARALLEVGISFDIYEAETKFGGLWNLENAETRVFPGLSCVTSRLPSAYLHKPFGPEVPLFPRQEDIAKYLDRIVISLRLADFAKLGCPVRLITSESDGVRVHLGSGDSIQYSAAVVAVGLQRDPGLPTFASTGTGRHFHSARYHEVRDRIQNRRIVVVGGGNSASAVVQDLIGRAESVHLALPRRGTWFLPSLVDGVPTDVPIVNPEPNASFVQQDIRTWLMRDTLGPLEEYGLRTPEYLPLQYAPIVGTWLVGQAAAGGVTVSYGVEAVEDHCVITADGQRIDYEYCIYATGYDEHSALSLIGENSFSDLYLRTISRRDPRIAVLGDLRSDAGGFWTFAYLSRIVAGYFRHLLSNRGFPLSRAELGMADLSGGGTFSNSRRQSPFVFSHALAAEGTCFGAALGVDLPTVSDLLEMK